MRIVSSAKSYMAPDLASDFRALIAFVSQHVRSNDWMQNPFDLLHGTSGCGSGEFIMARVNLLWRGPSSKVQVSTDVSDFPQGRCYLLMPLVRRPRDAEKQRHPLPKAR